MKRLILMLLLSAFVGCTDYVGYSGSYYGGSGYYNPWYGYRRHDVIVMPPRRPIPSNPIYRPPSGGARPMNPIYRPPSGGARPMNPIYRPQFGGMRPSMPMTRPSFPSAPRPSPALR